LSISSIIVTYQPNVELLSNLILGNISVFNKVILIDNGSNNIKSIRDAFKHNDKIFILALFENVGIAAAQNIGIKSLDIDDELIVFFDQDSSVDQLFIKAIESEYKIIEKKYTQGVILGPMFFHRTEKFEYPIIKFNKYGFRKKLYVSDYENVVEASCIISSGMCVRKDVLTKVGEMDSSLFIDYVDTEWCLRAISKGVRIFSSPALVMEHEIGDDNIKFFRWRIPVHSSFRRYYRIRNSFILFKYPHVPLIVCLRELIFSVAHQFLLIILTKNKKDYIKSLYRAVRDGLISLFKKR
tara:strand:- start:1750 stop:2640 length:891 start_codon:yes stop_codon:yes gene_type:complete